jgi:hypothetical protein
MHEITTRQLHFAAYLKAHGAEFLGCEDRIFRFRSDKPLDCWRIEHANSDARRVDLNLIELRRFLK